jgi:hypothetical protein
MKNALLENGEIMVPITREADPPTFGTQVGVTDKELDVSASVMSYEAARSSKS